METVFYQLVNVSVASLASATVISPAVPQFSGTAAAEILNEADMIIGTNL